MNPEYMITDDEVKDYLKYKKLSPKNGHTNENTAKYLEEWERLGKPHIWSIAETKDIDGNTYEVQTDCGWGHVRLMINGVMYDESYDSQFPIIHPEVVVLEKNYFDCKKYIWV